MFLSWQERAVFDKSNGSEKEMHVLKKFKDLVF